MIVFSMLIAPISDHIWPIPRIGCSLKDCIGTLDGVHIDVVVTLEDQVSYLEKKEQSVMSTCSFHKCFAFIYGI